MKNKVLFLLFLALISINLMGQTSRIPSDSYLLHSPNGKISVFIKLGDKLSYSVKHEDTRILDDSQIMLLLDDGTALGPEYKGIKTKETSVDQTIEAHFYKKNQIKDCYNELEISFRNDLYKVVFRAYDDGIAVLI